MMDAPNYWRHKLRHCIRLMGRRSQKAFVGTLFVVLSSLSAAQGVRMTIQQVWSGLGSSKSNPYYANIENFGPHEEARLATTGVGNRSSIDYPIELPTGARKRILFTSGSYNDDLVYLRTSSGSKEATIKGSYSSEETRFGLISDNPSDLIFLKGPADLGTDGSTRNAAVGVGGCIPDDAPDRRYGYICLDALVLGDGTEKLRDQQIAAIRQYVQTGGTLVFIGGAAQSASNDPRWKDILPVSNTSVATNNGLTERIGKIRLGTIKSNVSKGTCYVRGFGAGIVSILSVNPFESPIRESEDRRSIMSKAVRAGHNESFNQILISQIGGVNDQDRYRYSSSSRLTPAYATATIAAPAAPSTMLPYPTSGAILDPYEIKPPSITAIMWILISYAIVVVPINFFVLRRIKRLELAWVTTPIVSILFSWLLLNSTIGLYKASATTRTTSIAILGGNSDESLIFGRSEMFFPRAKSYDLGLANVDSILAHEEYGYSSSNSSSSGINLIDDGRNIEAPNVQTGNLAFKELSYVQTTKELHGLSITLATVNGSPSLHIVNQSHSVLSGINLFGPGVRKEIKEPVPSGGSVQIPVADIIRSKPNSKEDNNVTGWQVLSATSPNKIIVLGAVDSMKVGPKYGQGHPSSKYMVLSVPQWSGG